MTYSAVTILNQVTSHPATHIEIVQSVTGDIDKSEWESVRILVTD